VSLLAASGWWLWSLLVAVAHVAIAFWPGRVAAREGHSFVCSFLLSLSFVALAPISTIVVSDRSATAY